MYRSFISRKDDFWHLDESHPDYEKDVNDIYSKYPQHIVIPVSDVPNMFKPHETIPELSSVLNNSISDVFILDVTDPDYIKDQMFLRTKYSSREPCFHLVNPYLIDYELVEDLQVFRILKTNCQSLMTTKVGIPRHSWTLKPEHPDYEKDRSFIEAKYPHHRVVFPYTIHR